MLVFKMLLPKMLPGHRWLRETFGVDRGWTSAGVPAGRLQVYQPI